MNRELIRLIIGQFFVHTCMTGTRLAAPLLALRDGHTPGAVGFLLSLFALTQVFLALPAGRYADRHGFMKPMLAAIALAFFGTAIGVAFPRFEVLCLSALLTGAGCGISIIALQRHAGRVAHEASELRQIFSWLSLGPAIANFLGPMVTGLIIDHSTGQAGNNLSYRIAFAVLALFSVVAWWCVRSAQEMEPAPPKSDGQPHHAWDLLREQSFRRLLIVNWLVASCWDVHTFVVPLLGHDRGLSASEIGAVLGVFALAAFVIRVLLPAISRHLREMTVVMAAMVLTAAIFAVYPLMPNAWAMAFCSALLGIGLGSVQPMAMSMLHQITPEERHGEAVGLRLMLINGSSVCMPLMFGAAGAAIGVGGVFWVMGALVGAGSRMAWVLGKTPLPTFKVIDSSPAAGPAAHALGEKPVAMPPREP
ncbi:MFS transporter [Comamonas sp.]|uniref:MFS transporter n=1 Tax=Comamonas sp. TaxID=34028 RepID=UPI00289DC502|nr:MFS transporter [Comamonas sp.]